MPPTAARMLFQDARPGHERLLSLSGAVGEPVVALTPEDLPEAFERLARLSVSGRHVGGYFSYELGYALEPRLLTMLPENRSGPLLWFCAFANCRDNAPDEGGRAYVGPLRPEWNPQDYRWRFDEVKRLIAAGDIYQANLSFRAHFGFVGDPLALYRKLLSQAGAGYCAYLDTGARQILSLSPELFFAFSPSGALVTKPMKGTAARGENPAADTASRLALEQSAKDRAENLMIVDLMRNDVGRLAKTGSVSVENLFQVETYPTLHAMVSTVKAQCEPGVGIRKIISALFPCGSVTGAPKIRAMEVLRGLESSPRNAYCGAIGYFAPDGNALFNVAIRTITLENGLGTLGVGGGVVQDSHADAEYAECLLKARYFEEARAPLRLIETLRYEPRTGFVRLDRHLARLEASARTFGLPFSKDAAMAVLEGAVQAATSSLRVRLVLDESGFAVSTAPFILTDRAWSYVISDRRISSADALSRYKTDWRQFYDSERERSGADEVIFLNERGELAEGSITNIFVRRDGVMLTPPLSSGALDGVLRRELLETRLCHEQVLTEADLGGEVYFGNSLRGLIPAASNTRRQCAE